MDGKRQVLAVDQGTTSTKGYLVDAAGSMEALDSHSHNESYPNDGWVEHDPEQILGNIRSLISSAGDQADAIGLANQGETVVAWDSTTGDPLGPAIVWSDCRTADMLSALGGRGEQLSRSISGLPLDPYFSASKFAWILDTVPGAAQASQAGRLRLGTSDAFFLARLTGRFVTDATTASRTGLMDLKSLTWSRELCELYGVPAAALPEIEPTVADFGFVRGSGASDLRITASVVDQQAALIGHGCFYPGRIKITFGTGAFALAVLDRLPDPAKLNGLLPTVAWLMDDRNNPVYALDGGSLSAGSAVDWAIRLGLAASVDELNGLGAPAIERGLVFVPALAGLGSPHWDRTAGGMWIGLSLANDARDLCQAILEGVALQAAEIVAQFDRCGGDTDAPVSIDGGLSRNPYFCQFLATATGRTVTVPESPDLTSLGIARLAMVGAGIAESLTATPQPPSAAIFRPTARTHADRWRTTFSEAIRRSKGWAQGKV